MLHSGVIGSGAESQNGDTHTASLPHLSHLRFHRIPVLLTAGGMFRNKPETKVPPTAFHSVRGRPTQAQRAACLRFQMLHFYQKSMNASPRRNSTSQQLNTTQIRGMQINVKTQRAKPWACRLGTLGLKFMTMNLGFALNLNRSQL